MKITLDLPEIEGYEYTGEYRRAQKFEPYESNGVGIINAPKATQNCFHILKKKAPKYVVLDSVAGLIPSEILKQKDMFSYSPMAWQSRSWNQALIRLLPLLRNGSALVVINQVRGSMGPVAAIETMPGGKDSSSLPMVC